jgi:hypothetical protein
MATPSNPSDEPRLAEQIEDAIDAAEAERILADPTEERIPLAKVKADLGL